MNYINQTLMQDVIEQNPFTTIFQNDTRPRSGKIKKPFYPENMVKNILKSYHNLQIYKQNIKLIPVCINYERVFEEQYLTTEAITGKMQPETTFISLMQKIFTMKPGKIGKIFVTYGQEIDLKKYVADFTGKGGEESAPIDFENLSMKLTQDLYFR